MLDVGAVYYLFRFAIGLLIREHYQWNMDIWGVSHVTAEAELISSIVQMLKSVQLSASDVVIKVIQANQL